MTKKVAIIVDDIVRDLIPLTLLAIELHRNNLKPYLVPARLQVIEIRKIKSYIFEYRVIKINKFKL